MLHNALSRCVTYHDGMFVKLYHIFNVEIQLKFKYLPIDFHLIISTLIDNQLNISFCYAWLEIF